MLLTVLLAIRNIVGPVAGVENIIVEQREWTLLDGSSTVPALPVACATCLMSKHTIQPWAVIGSDWSLCI